MLGQRLAGWIKTDKHYAPDLRVFRPQHLSPCQFKESNIRMAEKNLHYEDKFLRFRTSVIMHNKTAKIAPISV